MTKIDKNNLTFESHTDIIRTALMMKKVADSCQPISGTRKQYNRINKMLFYNNSKKMDIKFF